MEKKKKAKAKDAHAGGFGALGDVFDELRKKSNSAEPHLRQAVIVLASMTEAITEQERKASTQLVDCALIFCCRVRSLAGRLLTLVRWCPPFSGSKNTRLKLLVALRERIVSFVHRRNSFLDVRVVSQAQSSCSAIAV